MRTKLFGCVVIMAVVATGLMAMPSTQTYNQFIGLSNLSERMIHDFSQGNMSDFILECPAGTSLPFKLTLKGELLALESAATEQLHVLKTCYVRCPEKENFLFSTDLQTWKSFAEFFTGEIKVSIELESGEPMAGLQLELNQRRN